MLVESIGDVERGDSLVLAPLTSSDYDKLVRLTHARCHFKECVDSKTKQSLNCYVPIASVQGIHCVQSVNVSFQHDSFVTLFAYRCARKNSVRKLTMS